MTTPPVLRPPVPASKLWLGALMLAVCETWINFGAASGLNWFLSVLATSLAFVSFRLAAGKPLHRNRLLALILGCFLSGGAAVTTNPQITWLVLAGTIGTLAIALRADADPADTQALGARDLLLSSVITGRDLLREARLRLVDARQSAQSEHGISVLRGIALATPITAGFALLLSNADPLMAYWRDTLHQALLAMSFVPRTLCFVGFGAVSLGALGSAVSTRTTLAGGKCAAPARRIELGSMERMIVLASVVTLFGIFFALQISHLFGNAGGLAGSGITYAQAAHEGFGELTIAASLCAALLIGLAAGPVGVARTRSERALGAVLILQAQLLLWSAYYRLGIYENVYGFTELRLYVQCYTGVVFVALGQLGLEIIGQPDFRRLARHWAVTAFIAIAALVYWNHAAWIARANFERYEARDTLDLSYLLGSLGPDAVPEIIRFSARLPTAMQTGIRACLRSRYPMATGLNRQFQWYEWNYRRGQLVTALRTLTAPISSGQVAQLPSSRDCVWR